MDARHNGDGTGGTVMYAEERQQAILALARSKGRVDVVALAEEFSVTTETIRRDLTVLERAGTIRRVHGGAMPVERLGFEPELAARDAVMTEEKQRIAKAALEELPADGSVIVDAGTTTARFVQLLPTDRELTVIVNSPPHAAVLATRPNLTVIILGGRVRGRTLATVDDWVLRPLADLWVDVAFMATNGCSVERGLTTSDQAEAAVKRAMIASSRRRVLLADRTKIGHDHLVRFGDLADIDVLITDTGLDTDLAADLAAEGPEIVRA